MRIGLLGLGTVGAAVARRLLDERGLLAERAGAPLELTAAAVRDLSRVRPGLTSGEVDLTTSAEEIVADPSVEVVVEVMGGEEPAGGLIAAALESGKAVVTANKVVMARRGPALAELARRQQLPLLYEAAVGGAIPVIGLLRQGLLGNRLRLIEAVLNGTTNFILEQLVLPGASLTAAVAEAQRLGYAEADPSADLDGTDAACKLSIVAWLAFGCHVPPEGIATEGIRHLDAGEVAQARRSGALRLLARATLVDHGAELSVAPTPLPAEHPLAGLSGPGNGIVLHGDLSGPLVLTGAGAGAGPTAGAVVGDLVSAARQLTGRPAAWIG